jgi:hypothetical protein
MSSENVVGDAGAGVGATDGLDDTARGQAEDAAAVGLAQPAPAGRELGAGGPAPTLAVGPAPLRHPRPLAVRQELGVPVDVGDAVKHRPVRVRQRRLGAQLLRLLRQRRREEGASASDDGQTVMEVCPRGAAGRC